MNLQSGKAAATWILSRRWGLELPAKLQVDFGRRVQSTCEQVARELSHAEVLDLFATAHMTNSRATGTRASGLLMESEADAVRLKHRRNAVFMATKVWGAFATCSDGAQTTWGCAIHGDIDRA